MVNNSFRKKCNSRLPGWYNPILHLVCNFILLTFPLVFTLLKIEDYSIKTGLLFFSFLLIWGVIEYFIHRFILHGNQKFLKRLILEHSVYHHGYFTEKDPVFDTTLDLNRVFLFSIDLLTLIIVSIGLSSLIYFYIDPAISKVFFLASLCHLILYEFFHFISHSKIQVFQQIKEHHLLHHHRDYKEHKI